MEKKYTKGPWLIAGEDARFVYALGPKGTNAFWCQVQSAGPGRALSDECKANARLIAAAPDLLEALQRLRIAYVNMLESGRDRIIALGGDCDSVEKMEKDDPALAVARKTIAKAKGKNHE